MTEVVNPAMRALLTASPGPLPALPTPLQDDLAAGVVVRDGCLLLAAYDAGGDPSSFHDRTDLEASVNDLTLWSGDDDEPWDGPVLAALGRQVVAALRDLVGSAGHALPVRLVLSVDPPFANVRMFSLRPDEPPWIEDPTGLDEPALLEDVDVPDRR